jgi:hypothetical protein
MYRMLSVVFAFVLALACQWRADDKDSDAAARAKREYILKRANEVLADKHVKGGLDKVIAQSKEQARREGSTLREPTTEKPEITVKVAFSHESKATRVGTQLKIESKVTIDVAESADCQWVLTHLTVEEWNGTRLVHMSGVGIAHHVTDTPLKPDVSTREGPCVPGTYRTFVAVVAYPVHTGKFDINKLVILDGAEDVFTISPELKP